MHGFSSSSQPPPASGRVLVSRRASDIQPEAIRWLWRQRIALGKLCLIAGQPGLGKSQVTTYTAATVSSGGTWCTGEKCEVGDVLILSAEDDPHDTIRPRLEACGANLDRVHIIEAVRVVNVKRDRFFNLKQDLDTLGERLMLSPDAKLVIIDPISAYLRGVNSQNNVDVRGVLAPLAKLAADHGVAVVCVTHLNKGLANGATDPLARVIDSTAFVAAVRTAFLVAQDHANPDRRFFLSLKSNISSMCPGLAFRIEPHVLAGVVETSRVSWDGPVTTTAQDALTAPTQDEIDTAKDTAEACLRVFDKEKATELRSSDLIKSIGMHENTFISARGLKKFLKPLHIQPHERSNANYYLKADFLSALGP